MVHDIGIYIIYTTAVIKQGYPQPYYYRTEATIFRFLQMYKTGSDHLPNLKSRPTLLKFFVNVEVVGPKKRK